MGTSLTYDIASDPNYATKQNEKQRLQSTLGFIHTSHVYIQNGRNLNWWNIFEPPVFEACLKIIFTCHHASDWPIASACMDYTEYMTYFGDLS